MKLSEMPNIGEELEKRLAKVGITDGEILKQLESKEAFMRLRLSEGETCYNALCALEGAIEGIRWHNLAPEVKSDLKAFFNSLK